MKMYDATTQHWCDNCDRSYSQPQPVAGMLLCAACEREWEGMLA